VLKEVSLNVEPGLVYSIVGPSGCGKSTLLYLLGLLDRPDGGIIRLGSLDVSQISDEEATELRNRYLGFIFQFHFLINEFTALENVMLPMRKSGDKSAAVMRDRAHQLLKEVGLDNKVDRRANHLSGGEQQRVAVARALANSPSVVLADEPTGNLDSTNSHKVFDLMTRIAREENLSMLVVTHNPAIAQASDIVLRMEDGLFVDWEVGADKHKAEEEPKKEKRGRKGMGRREAMGDGL
jgi:lipoprotein-releasing system ATP-binding protein